MWGDLEVTRASVSEPNGDGTVLAGQEEHEKVGPQQCEKYF